ncbi:MAG: DEAD/DEAH box helicase [Verrucomicrobia bacterium]|nr:DEAD/DEAH box helicase [Verrucomicrobiota bacterium]
MDTPAFSELGLEPELIKAIDKLGYESPSPIQALTIPLLLSGKDVVGLSETGSGKTAAFGLPALQMIDTSVKATQVLILCPTRELTVQVCEEIHKLGSHVKNLAAIPVYGGAPIDRQIRYLKQGSHIVVGTPGRLMDHMERGTLDLSQTRMIILDEADRMLDMGFRDDMEHILGQAPKERQTLFFSATMNKGVERLIEHFGNEPEQVRIHRKTLTVSTVEQFYFEVRNRSKIEVVSRLLDIDPPRLAIIFCNTKRMVDECCDALINRGYSADRIHGDITQIGRERVLKKFRGGQVEILVATDVAARGLDIDEVDAVFNYDLPQDPEDYVHRIGRTGRAGREGKAYSFVFGKDIYRLGSIERYTKHTIQRSKIPSQEDIEGKKADVILELVKSKLEAGDFKNYGDWMDRLHDQGHTTTDIASALLSLLREQKGRDGEAIAEDTELLKPERSRSSSSGRPEQRKRSYSRGKSGGGGSRFSRERGSDSSDRRSSDRPRSDRPRPDRSKSERPATDRPRFERPSSGGPRSDGPRTERPRPERPSSSDRPKPAFRPKTDSAPKPGGHPFGERKVGDKRTKKNRTDKDKGKPSWSKRTSR